MAKIEIKKTPETNSGRAIVARPKKEITLSLNLFSLTPAKTPKKRERGTNIIKALRANIKE
jgi:hypothetical protein